MRLDGKRASMAILAVAAIGAAIAVPALGGSHPNPTFKVLGRPEKPADRLPASSGSGPLGAIDRDAARLVGAIDGRSVYLAPGPEDTVCVLDAADDGSLGGSCSPRDAIRDRPTYTAWSEGDSDAVAVAVPVPDAYDRAEIDGRAVPVSDNVALTRVRPGTGAVRLSGDDATLEGDLDVEAP
jgi:hypothetical protein